MTVPRRVQEVSGCHVFPDGQQHIDDGAKGVGGGTIGSGAHHKPLFIVVQALEDPAEAGRRAGKRAHPCVLGGTTDMGDTA